MMSFASSNRSLWGMSVKIKVNFVQTDFVLGSCVPTVSYNLLFLSSLSPFVILSHDQRGHLFTLTIPLVSPRLSFSPVNMEAVFKLLLNNWKARHLRGYHGPDHSNSTTFFSLSYSSKSTKI